MTASTWSRCSSTTTSRSRTRCTRPAGAASAPRCCWRRSPGPARSEATTWQPWRPLRDGSTSVRGPSGSPCPRARRPRRAGLPPRPRGDVAGEGGERVLTDLEPRGSRVLAFVNGMGGTPELELYLLYHEVDELLRAAGLEPARNLVGSYITSLEMAGASLTVLDLDDELESLWDAPVDTAALRWGA